MSDENISQWIQLFVSMHMQNPDGINSTDSILADNIKKDLSLFMNICNQILLIQDENDDSIKIAKEMSSIMLFKVLNYQNLSDLNKKRSIIINEIAEQTANSLKQNIFSEHETIRNLCIKNYSLLFSILLTNWEDGINEVVASINSENFLPYGTIVLLSVMKEIINTKNFLNDILPTFSEQFIQIFVFCIEILSKDQTESVFIPELRLEACKYIHDLVFMYPEILNDSDSEKVTFGAKIPFLLEMMPNSFQIDDFVLFESLIDLLNLFVEKFYSCSMNFMETVSSYVSNGIDLIFVNQQYAYLSICFWNRVAKYEGEIIEIFRCSNTPDEEIQPLQPLLSEIAFKPLIEFFINFSEIIDVGDVKVENSERSEVHKIIVSTIKSIYMIVPSTFDTIREVINDEISKEKWTNVYSGILLIYTICDEPFDSNVGSFIVSQLDFLIQKSAPDQIPRIRYNALLVIGLVFQNYSKLILQQEGMEEIWIGKLVEIFQNTIQFDEKQQLNISEDNCSIFERYAKIIHSVATLWYSEPNESKIHLYFDQFYEIESTLFKLGIKNNFFNLIEKSSEALNRMISFSTNDMIQKIGSLYEKTLDELLQLKNSIIEEETFSIAASCYCSNLTTILIELKSSNGEIISQFSEQTIQVLFEILEIKNEKLWKEIFWTIASLIIAADSSVEVFTPYTFNILYEQFINTAFNSNNPELIRSTSCLISNIFLHLPKKLAGLNEMIPEIFEILIFFLNENEMKDAYPFILEAVSNMFLCNDQKNETIDQLESPLYETIMKIIDLSKDIDITNENEVEYDNLFYQYLCDTVRSYAKVFYNSNDENHEKQQLLLVDRLGCFVCKLSLKISDDLYQAFTLVVKEFASKCTKNNCSILNNQFVHRVFELGFENCSLNDLCGEMKEIDDIIKGE